MSKQLPCPDPYGGMPSAPTGLDPMRSFFAGIAAFIAVILGASGCKRTEAPQEASVGLPHVRLDTDWYPEPEQGGFYQAQVRGFYKEAGLDLTIMPGGPNTHPIVELTAGHAQFALAGSDDVIEQCEQGLPLLIVGAFMERYPEAVLVHEESPVRSLRDLDGKTVIAVPGAGWIALLQETYGIKINVIPVEFELARFMGDKAAIQQVYLTDEPYYVKRNGVAARTLMISDMGYNPYRVIITTKQYAKAHPEVVRAFVAASTKGWRDFIQGDASACRTLISTLNPHSTGEFFDATVSTLRSAHIVDGRAEAGETIGGFSLKRLQHEIDLLARIKFIKKAYPAETIATEEFVPR